MNALDEIFRTGTVCRRKVYGVASIDDDCFDKFFSDYLSYCKMQNFSRSWMDNTIAALRLRTVRRLRPCVSEYVAGGGNGLADRFMRCSHYAAGSLS